MRRTVHTKRNMQRFSLLCTLIFISICFSILLDTRDPEIRIVHSQPNGIVDGSHVLLVAQRSEGGKVEGDGLVEFVVGDAEADVGEAHC